MSEKKPEYQTTPKLPAIAASEPCATEADFSLAIFYRDGIACQICRWWLIEITTMGDSEPRYMHGHKIPPEFIGDALEITHVEEVLEDVITWIEKNFFERLQKQESWHEAQIEELKKQFQGTLTEMLFEVVGGGLSRLSKSS